MNDLAEKALHGLDVARREIVARPMLTFATLGFAVSCAVVVAGARVNAGRATRPLNKWLGLQNSHGVRPDDWVPGAAMLGAVAALVLLWLGVVAFVRRREPPEGRVWWVAAAWALPFVLGPPLMGSSVESYAAFGLLQRHGLSPYDFGPNRLGSDPIVAAIEPGSRGTPSAAGPLGTLAQHLSVSISAGSALGAVLILRAVGLIAAVIIGRLAADLAGLFRSRALTLTVLNPLVLLYLVSAARLDGMMLAFALAAISAATQRRWIAALALASLAGSVAAQGFVLIPVDHRRPLARPAHGPHLAAARPRRPGRSRHDGRGQGWSCADGFGWLRTVTKQFSAHTPFSIAGAIASCSPRSCGARPTTISRPERGSPR